MTNKYKIKKNTKQIKKKKIDRNKVRKFPNVLPKIT